MQILVVEDNQKLAAAIATGLREHGWGVSVAHEGYAGEELAAGGSFDAIVLDRMLPDRDGLEVVRSLRRHRVGTPVLVLTALSGTQEKVLGLDAGADDYLAKPFEFAELLARLRALLRRASASESRVLRFEDLELDLDRRRATRAGHTIELTLRQFSLLEFFLRNPSRVLSRRAIVERVWDISYEPASNVVDVYVAALRKKIDRDFTPALIHTVIGTGYRFGLTDKATTPAS